jgi:hypothetical protein
MLLEARRRERSPWWFATTAAQKKASGKCRNLPRPSDYRQRRSLLGRVAETPSLRELFLSFLTLAEGGGLA